MKTICTLLKWRLYFYLFICWVPWLTCVSLLLKQIHFYIFIKYFFPSVRLIFFQEGDWFCKLPKSACLYVCCYLFRYSLHWSFRALYNFLLAVSCALNDLLSPVIDCSLFYTWRLRWRFFTLALIPHLLNNIHMYITWARFNHNWHLKFATEHTSYHWYQWRIA